MTGTRLDLNALYYFVQVVDRRSYTATARALGLPKSSLSRHISELELHLGVRLIQRTSRRFVVTDVGKEVYQRAQAMLSEAQAAEHVVQRRLAEPAGLVRFTCPAALAHSAMADILPRFMALFPKIDVDLHATNRRVDVVDEGLDLALRAHIDPLPDSAMIQRALATTRWRLFASPEYLQRQGTPEEPHDLRRHVALAYRGVGRGRESSWRVEHPSLGEITVPFVPRLRCDSMEAVKRAAEAGVGIVTLPDYYCRAELDRGRLRIVLPEWSAGLATVTLLVPSTRGQLPSVRAFIDFLAAELPAATSLAPPSSAQNGRQGGHPARREGLARDEP